LRSVQDELSTAQGAHSAQRARIADLETALAAAEAERNRSVQGAETTIANLQRELVETRAELRTSVERGDRLEQESRSRTEPAAGLEEALATSRRQVVELEANLAECWQATAQLRDLLRGMGIRIS